MRPQQGQGTAAVRVGILAGEQEQGHCVESCRNRWKAGMKNDQPSRMLTMTSMLQILLMHMVSRSSGKMQ
jgi:hypothetical protein